MLKLTLSIAIFWTFGHSLLANEIVEKPAVLFQMLKSNENWTTVAKKGEVILLSLIHISEPTRPY